MFNVFFVKIVSATKSIPLPHKSTGEAKLGTYKVLNKLKA